MDTIDDIIERSLASGIMTQAQHDEILLRIQADGEIDETEQAQLSRVFSAVQSGAVTIVDSVRTTQESEQAAREEAETLAEKLERETTRRRAGSIIQRVDTALAAGTISESEHEELLRLIHADGKIDEEEKQQLSRLFDARQSGALRVETNSPQSSLGSGKSRKLRDELTQLAMDRDEQRFTPSQVSSVDSTPPLKEEPEDTELQLPESPPQASRAQEFSAPLEQNNSVDDSDVHSISAFLQRASRPRKQGRPFQLHNDRLLDVNLNGKVWTKAGSMVGYYGIVKFTREGVLEHGVGKLMKKAMTGEGAMLMKATGQGNLYLADKGKKVSILHLGGHSLVVAGTNLLAFEESVEWDITFMKQLAAMWSGGLFNVRMSGQGDVAVTTFGDPIVLRVLPGEPVMTDVHATVAWSGGLAPQIKTDVAMKTLVGRASGETLQMRFEGDGFVIIQPYEETPNSAPEGSI